MISKESFESKVIPSSSSLFSHMMVWLSILAIMLPFPENSIWLFPLFIFMLLKSNLVKKNFGKVLYFFYYLNICLVSTISCGIIIVTGYCNAFEEIKYVTEKDIENKRTKDWSMWKSIKNLVPWTACITYFNLLLSVWKVMLN